MKSHPPLPLRILTHNIRYATSAPFKGEKPWAQRKQHLINELLYHTRHIPESLLCLQEVLHIQLQDILAGLNQPNQPNQNPNPNPKEPNEEQEWASIGVGRSDGHQAGEYSPILYRPHIYSLTHSQTIWLSQTPHTPSRGWDAASIRIVTIALLTHRVTRKGLLVLSTHLDDQGSRSRYESARLIVQLIQGYVGEGSCWGDRIGGVVLAGDFNSEVQQEAYRVFTGVGSGLVDARERVAGGLRYGNEITFTGFGFEGEPRTRIDYVMLGVGREGGEKGEGEGEGEVSPWDVKGYAVLPNRFDDGVYNSDHRAVVVDAELG
ncbi:hypothetical protein FQN53_003376 [Emmonsiellopsis sp. PD_33]|nr:hypothetical protein FQN53_003376 [Emmonsiellopsis sp. PD_33]